MPNFSTLTELCLFLVHAHFPSSFVWKQINSPILAKAFSVFEEQVVLFMLFISFLSSKLITVQKTMLATKMNQIVFFSTVTYVTVGHTYGTR